MNALLHATASAIAHALADGEAYATSEGSVKISVHAKRREGNTRQGKAPHRTTPHRTRSLKTPVETSHHSSRNVTPATPRRMMALRAQVSP